MLRMGVTYDGSRGEHGGVIEIVDDIELEIVPLIPTLVLIAVAPCIIITYHVTGDQGARELAVHDDSSTGETIGRNVCVRNGEVCSRTNSTSHKTGAKKTESGESRQGSREPHST